MQKKLFLVLIGLGLAFINLPDAQALMAVSTIDFPPDTYAVDTTSGDSADFLYSQSVDPGPGLFELTSASIALTHEGNQNDPPTREVWSLFSASGILIGTLGESNSSTLEDSWLLPDALIDEIKEQTPWQVDFVLTEQTPYSSEKLTLIRSELAVNYDRRNAEVPTPVAVPEATTLLMLGLSLLAGRFGTRRT